MQFRRTTVMIAIATACLAATSVAGAVPQAPLGAGQHRGAGTATALEVTVLGNGLTLGAAEVLTSSAPLAAVGTGTGAILPALGNISVVNSAPDGTTETVDAPGECGPIGLPADFPVVALATACGDSAATIAGGLPSVVATGEVASVGVDATEVLALLAPVDAVIGPVVDDLLIGLKPVFDNLNDVTGIDAQSLISELLDGITNGGELVTMSLGPASSAVTTTVDTVVSTSTAQAVHIEVINRDLIPVLEGLPALEPVFTIDVVSAAASVTAFRTGPNAGTAVPTVDPALVTLTIAPDIALLLGLAEGANVISVTVGQTICIPLPAPLGESCIIAADGTTAPTEDGGQRATATGVGIKLLDGLPNGGIVLNLSAVSAEAAAGAPAETDRTPTPEPAVPQTARTGGGPSAPLAIGLGGFGMALAAMAATARRRGLVG